MPGILLDCHLADLALAGHSPGSVEARRLAVRRLARALPVPILEATPADLAAWRAGLLVSPNTIVHYISHATQFYAWCVRQDLIDENPAAGLARPRLIRGLPRPISEHVLMAAVDAADPPVRLWLLLAGWCGLRAKEIALLRRERVLDTAGRPVILIAHDATKGTRERAVAMPGWLVAELRPYLPRAGWVFRRMDGQPGPNSPARVSQLANRWLHEHGITESLHQLRHRYATELLIATGGNLRVVQEAMGHADPATTAGYAAIQPAALAAAAELLPAPARLRVVAG
ncbi:MAG: tyrosine-type recombinase/integrase [Streptosporangiaceae bacterium]